MDNIPIIHGLQFPTRREGPHDDFHGSLSLQVPSCEERAGKDAVDGETCTAGKEFPLQVTGWGEDRTTISSERKAGEQSLACWFFPP